MKKMYILKFTSLLSCIMKKMGKEIYKIPKIFSKLIFCVYKRIKKEINEMKNR